MLEPTLRHLLSQNTGCDIDTDIGGYCSITLNQGALTLDLHVKSYRDDGDYWRIREFLRRVFLLNGSWEVSWHVNRFDYWRWHGVENLGDGSLEENVFIWETEDGQIAAVLNPENKGHAFLQVRPDIRTHELEDDMITVAEKHLATLNPEGRMKLTVWADENDAIRRAILKRRGYTKGDRSEYKRRRPMSEPIPDILAPSGYDIRSLKGPEELPARSLLSWKAFHPGEPEEGHEEWEWYLNIQRAPLYRRDLDLVAVAPDGELATFCTVWFDDVTRSGVFEPVGTAPEHQRRGIGKAVMYEGLRRLKRMGATVALVGSYNPAAHALYASVGFTETFISDQWEKEL